MIEIKELEIEKNNDLKIENGILSISHLNALVQVLKYQGVDFYEVSLHKGDITFINEYLNCLFGELLKYQTTFLPYELELRNISIGQELIDDFKPIFRICSHNSSTSIKVDLIHIPFMEGAIPHQISKSKWSTQYLLDQLKMLKDDNDFLNFFQDEEPNRYGLEFYFDKNENILNSIKSVIIKMNLIGIELSKRVNQFSWKEIYEKDELIFSTEVILPLLRKMKFKNVKYTHGSQEFGRDFIFKHKTKFGADINYGVQVKAGNLSGKANSNIQELINQVNIAIQTPFNEIADENKYYISTMIIAISGKYTNQAQTILLGKIPNYLKGNIVFWDKDKILELIEKYWFK